MIFLQVNTLISYMLNFCVGQMNQKIGLLQEQLGAALRDKESLSKAFNQIQMQLLDVTQKYKLELDTREACEKM